MCQKGHTWPATYSTIHRGTGCPKCAGVKRRNKSDYKALAQARGFEWLGPEVPRVSEETSWRCNHGHTWSAPYRRLKLGHGCPKCAGLARKLPDDYRALAKERGFEWLGPETPNNRTKTNWRCSAGHEWSMAYGNMANQGHGCPYCSGRAPKSASDYHVLAAERGFQWLGPEAPTVTTKTGLQ
jgi:hypothetical protein